MYSVAWFLGTLFEASVAFADRLVFGKKDRSAAQIVVRLVVVVVLALTFFLTSAAYLSKEARLVAFLILVCFGDVLGFAAKRRWAKLKERKDLE